MNDQDRALNGMEKSFEDLADKAVLCWCFIFIFKIIFIALINVLDEDMQVQ